MRRRLAALLAGVTLGCVLAAGTSSASTALQPYQMIRSLQLVQDRIANGDHAALPMQRKLLELIDGRLRNSTAEDFADPKNLSALFVYAMSGGNPVTAELVFARLPADSEVAPLAKAVGAYLTGDFGTAKTALAAFSPYALGAHAPFVALVKGTVMANDDPPGALADLDTARLLAPGTLVEEAALRRSLLIAVATGNAEIFARTASAYVRRFLRSPYASQFAEAFVSGLSGLHAVLDADEMADILSWMTAEQAETIGLRLSRQAAIRNDPAMIAFAETLSQRTDRDDPRAQLYSSLGGVASPEVDETLKNLEAIDRSRLSASDQALLDAATDIARTVVAPPTESVVPASLAEPEAPEAAPASDTDAYISSTRAKLDAVDKLLEGGTDR